MGLLLSACGDDGNEATAAVAESGSPDDTGCIDGTEACACIEGGLCVGDLICLSGVCVDDGSSDGADEGATDKPETETSAGTDESGGDVDGSCAGNCLGSSPHHGGVCPTNWVCAVADGSCSYLPLSYLHDGAVVWSNTAEYPCEVWVRFVALFRGQLVLRLLPSFRDRSRWMLPRRPDARVSGASDSSGWRAVEALQHSVHSQASPQFTVGGGSVSVHLAVHAAELQFTLTPVHGPSAPSQLTVHDASPQLISMSPQASLPSRQLTSHANAPQFTVPPSHAS